MQALSESTMRISMLSARQLSEKESQAGRHANTPSNPSKGFLSVWSTLHCGHFHCPLSPVGWGDALWVWLCLHAIQSKITCDLGTINLAYVVRGYATEGFGSQKDDSG